MKAPGSFPVNPGFTKFSKSAGRIPKAIARRGFLFWESRRNAIFIRWRKRMAVVTVGIVNDKLELAFYVCVLKI